MPHFPKHGKVKTSLKPPLSPYIQKCEFNQVGHEPLHHMLK